MKDVYFNDSDVQKRKKELIETIAEAEMLMCPCPYMNENPDDYTPKDDIMTDWLRKKMR